MIQEILTAFAEIVALSGLGLIFVSAFLTDTQKSQKIVNSLQDGIANDSPNVQQEFELEEEFTQLPFLTAYEMAERFGVKVDTIVAHAKQWRNGQRYDYSFEEWASDFDTKYRWHFFWNADYEPVFYPVSSKLFTKHLLSYCSQTIVKHQLRHAVRLRRN